MSHHPELKSHHVILYVDTANISEGTEKDHCWIGWPYNSKPIPEYSTEIDPGEWITWIGLSISSPNDIINITRIKHKHKSDVFGRSKLNGDGNFPEKVIGTIMNDTNGEDESYTIFFSIYNGNNGGKRSGSFRVDPIIKVRPRG